MTLTALFNAKRVADHQLHARNQALTMAMEAYVDDKSMARLSARWSSRGGWPKRLDWIRIRGLRGWEGQRIEFRYPITAIVGENGVGKSTIIQAAAAAYNPSNPTRFKFASDFFPETVWEDIKNAQIEYSVREGEDEHAHNVRRLKDRWSGYGQRRERPVVYLDLSRVQPIPARVGYTKIIKTRNHKETKARMFDEHRLGDLGEIMARDYDNARMATTNVHAHREVPVLSYHGSTYSGFHQGAGETMAAELLNEDWPKYSLVVIDEIETSLHPRAQRRLIRKIADRCRELDVQVILTTHSPYILKELPPEARACVMSVKDRREVVYGVSPAFAMTKMDDVPQHECDLFVEDKRARVLLQEIIYAHAPSLAQTCRIIPCGSAAVGRALGVMISQRRLPDPACVFLDGDQRGDQAPGCEFLPGVYSPEIVVFQGLKAEKWRGLDQRIGRTHTAIVDACINAMTERDEHKWIDQSATALTTGGDSLWQAMCAQWATDCISGTDAKVLTQPISDAVQGITPTPIPAVRRTPKLPEPKTKTKREPSATEILPLFAQSLDDDLE